MRVALVFDRSRDDTTGGYFERACRTLGLSADHWWLRDADRIPAGYDLYLRIDHGDDYHVPLPRRCRPAVFYAIDTHLAHSWPKIRRVAPQFDVVCCAQAAAARRLRGAVWVPLACDAELHGATGGEPRWDVAFIGTDGGVPRKFYLQALRERYPRARIGHAKHTELGAVYGRARIGFNYAIADDVNMRVFEVLAARALLVTNALAGDDFQRLGLEDRRHLVLYRSPRELFELIDHYLTHPDERRRIAEAGETLVLERHTYVHRVQALLAAAARQAPLPTPLTAQESLRCASS
jgi:hypothetical protein